MSSGSVRFGSIRNLCEAEKHASVVSLTELLREEEERERLQNENCANGKKWGRQPPQESIDASVSLRLRTGKVHASQRLNKISVTNWAETVQADIAQFRYPEDVDEVVDLVLGNDKIRCSGALHSCAPLIKSDGIILSLTKLDEILDIDAENRMVRVQSGVRIHDLCEALAPYGLAVGTLGTIDWQTISGAVMTGTHGGALTVPSLHEFVRSYTLVKPDGDIVKVERNDVDAEANKLFQAMAPSMGVFGAVVEMEMSVVPLQIVEARMICVPMSEVADRFDDVMKNNKYARVIIYPSIKKATIWYANPVESRDVAVKNGAVNNPGYTNFRSDAEKAILQLYLDNCNQGEYEIADAVLERVLESQLERLNHYCGQYNHVLCLERNNGIPHADIEFNFDYDVHREVLRTVEKYCESTRIPYYNFEIRTTKQDDAMLSCCQGRDAMWIDFQAKADVATPFFNAMQDILKPFGYRKHWAKGLDNTDPRGIVEQFPRVGEFIGMMKEFDPEGKFRNAQCEAWFRAMTDMLDGEKDEEESMDDIVFEKPVDKAMTDMLDGEKDEERTASTGLSDTEHSLDDTVFEKPVVKRQSTAATDSTSDSDDIGESDHMFVAYEETVDIDLSIMGN